MNFPRPAMLAALAALALPTALAADGEQTSPAIEALPIAFDENGMSGPGADLLLENLENTQFISIGEDHGFRDSAVLVSAFAAEAKDEGFDNYAIEVGPHSTELIIDILRKDGPDGLQALLAGRPLAIPFLNNREEAEAARNFLDEGRLWGVDQEFIGSPLLHLETLTALPGTDSDVFARFFEQERAAFARGDQGAVFMASASPSDWQALKDAARDSVEALAIIEDMQESALIYRSFFLGRGLDNNLDRVALIRANFLTAYNAMQQRTGTPPRVIMKFGATHAGRGTSNVSTFDLGSLVEGMAAANGLEALHVAYIPIGGEAKVIRPSPDGIFSVKPVEADDLLDMLRSAGVDMEQLESGEGHLVVPLDPVRRALGNGGLAELNATQRFLVLGFDYLVTTNSAVPAEPLAAR